MKKLVCGAGAFEAACHAHLEKMALSVKLGQAKAGVMAFATALFALPKAMAFNAGLDAPNVIAKLKDAVSGAKDGLSDD